MTVREGRALRIGVIVYALAHTGVAFAAPGSSQLSPIVITIPEQYHTGGAYTAIEAALDGSVYLGTTVYDGFAYFLRLPPGQREFQAVAQMNEVTGERTPGPYAQAKIHTKPAVAPDGKVYFGTKSGKPADDPRWQAQYPGGHLLVFDPRTGKVQDLGIPHARQSIIAVGVDPRRGIVYALTDPEGHLITFDPRTRTFADRGQFSPGSSPTRYLVVLANGDAFHPAGSDAFNRYNAATGAIERLSLKFTGSGTYEVSDIGHGPYAMAALPNEMRFYGVGRFSGETYTLVPEERSMTVVFNGRAVLPSTGERTIYYTMAGSPEGHVYYTGLVLGGGRPEGRLFILRLNTKAGRPEIVGEVAPVDPPTGWTRRYRLQTQGATIGPDGTLYVMLAYPLRVLVLPRLARP